MALLRRVTPLLALVFAAFVILGLPEGVFGTLWPTQRADLGRDVGDLSWLVTASTVGYLLATPASGHLTSRLGTGRVLLVALAGSAAGLVALAVAPGFGFLVAASVLFGAGAGTLDAVINAWVAVTQGTGAMGFLHAFFGVGAALGPLYAAGALDSGLGWRSVLLLLGIVEIVLLAFFWARRAEYDAATHPGGEVAASLGAHAEAGRLLGLTLLWFFVIVGAEVSVGSWGYSLLFEQRGFGATTAAFWVSAFWVTFTCGRFAMGIAGDRLHLVPSLAGSLALAAAGAALLWANPSAVSAGLAFPILGIGMALQFPAMVLLTPRWLGAGRTGIAMGYQLAAASLGAVTFANVIGRLANRFSLEVLGPILLAATIISAALLTVMVRTAAETAAPAVGGRLPN